MRSKIQNKKIILYGKEEICNQIKYVLNSKNIKMVTEISKLKPQKDTIIILCYIDKDEKKKIKKSLKYKKDYIYIEDIYNELNKGNIKKYQLNLKNIVFMMFIIRPKFNNKKLINKIPTRYLKPSEMLIKVLNSKTLNLDCKNIEETCNISSTGEAWGCCETWVQIPFGNFLNEQEDTYDNYTARIIKLSSLNKTYCFCNFNKCKYNHKPQKDKCINKLETKKYPKEITISIDKTCNLKCSSCRKKRYKANLKEQKKQEIIVKNIKKTGWLDKTTIIMAGQGEVFYSPTYRKILESDIKRDTIKLLTNGTLFNKKKWDFVSKIYKNIYVSVSIDSAKKETYRKLRCGNFDLLKKNLQMLGELRKENKIKEIQYNYVVQKDNYKEMIDFIKMAKEYNVDKIQFTKLNNWRTYTKKEYIEKSLIIDNKYLVKDFYELLKNPIFKDKMIDIESFDEFINNSKHYYGDINE